MEGKGYWSRDGKLYELGTKKHINFIIEDPQRFGVSRETIVQTYQRHHEKIPFEGKAREDLIIHALKEGWIRIRHYMRPGDYWSIQFYDYNRCKEDLISIVKNLIESNNMYPDEALIFSDFYDGTTKEYSSMNNGAEGFLQE